MSLTGTLVELGAPRRTPAGIPVREFRLEHRSRQIEADLARDVEVEMAAVALGKTAEILAAAKLGMAIRIDGFLARKSIKSAQPVIHVNTIEFVEGIQNGIQAQVQIEGQEGT